jgi:dTDP-4-dehydrorhamnose reductase
MRILITGKNGYIAKSIHSCLYSKYDITTIGRQDFDLTDEKSTTEWFQDKCFDFVIHTAVIGGNRLIEETPDIVMKNLLMYDNLMKCRNHFDKFIHFGSGAQFRSEPGPYGISKSIIADSMINKEHFYNIIVYGLFDENELDTRFIKANLKKYLNKESMIIHNDKVMTFFYMKDLVTLVNHIILEDPARLIKTQYASYVHESSLLEIADYINTLGDYTVPILFGSGRVESYQSKYNAPYKLNYIGLKEGIYEVFNKLK